MMLKNLPNLLTILRIVLIPILVCCFYIDNKTVHYITAGIFIFASITDYFDGFFARKWSAETTFGRTLDPIADKLLVVSTLMMLVHFHRAPVIPALAIVCREILVSGLREHLSEIKVRLPVTNFSKIKTAVQMAAIVLLLLGDEGAGIQYTTTIGTVCIWLVAALTIFSGYHYCRKCWYYF